MLAIELISTKNAVLFSFDTYWSQHNLQICIIRCQIHVSTNIINLHNTCSSKVWGNPNIHHILCSFYNEIIRCIIFNKKKVKYIFA